MPRRPPGSERESPAPPNRAAAAPFTVPATHPCVVPAPSTAARRAAPRPAPAENTRSGVATCAGWATADTWHAGCCCRAAWHVRAAAPVSPRSARRIMATVGCVGAAVVRRRRWPCEGCGQGKEGGETKAPSRDYPNTKDDTCWFS